MPQVVTQASQTQPQTQAKTPEVIEPVVGLCPKPVEEMDENELREFLRYVQTNRQSAVTFRAEVVKTATKEEEKKQANKSVGFDDLL